MKELPRVLVAKDLTLLIMGSLIGTGIFLTPGLALQRVDQSVPLMVCVWVLGGAISLAGALTYAEMAASRPQSGGLYIYIRDAFGPLPGFMFGWVYFFVIGMGALATFGLGLARNVNRIVLELPGDAALGVWGERAIAILAIAILATVNIRGTRHGANLQNWTTLVKAGALFLLGAVLVALGSQIGAAPDLPEAEPRTGTAFLAALGLALVPVLWSCSGWQRVPASAGEVRDPARAYPRAMFLGVAIVVGIYILATVGYVAALGPAGVVASHQTGSVAQDALAAVLGSWVVVPVSLLVVLSIFSTANGQMLTAPRVSFALARDGLFFPQLARVHTRFQTPAVAIAGGSLWAVVLVLQGDFDALLAYTVLGAWIFYGLAGAAIFVYRRRIPAAERGFSVPGYPFTPLAFVLGAMLVVGSILSDGQERSTLGLTIIGLGIPAYFLFRALRRGKAAPLDR